MTKIYLAILSLLLFTPQAFARDWPEIIKSGTLNVGMRTSAQIVYRPANSEKTGLLYDMVKDFADMHNLKLNIIHISSFSQYWQERDTKIVADKWNTPPVYDEIDIAAEIFTVTKTREQRVKMSAYIENVELFFSRKGKKISSYKELLGQSILTYEAMTLYPILIDEIKKQSLPYRQIYVTPLDDKRGTIKLPKDYQNDPSKINLLIFPKGTVSHATMSYQPIVNGNADTGINDAIGILYRVFEIGQFKDALRPLFPARKERSKLAWGSSYASKKLNQKIAEFMKKDRASERFSQRLEKYIGMTFQDYQTLITMFD